MTAWTTPVPHDCMSHQTLERRQHERTRTPVLPGRITIPKTPAKLLEDTIHLLCFRLEIKLGTKPSAHSNLSHEDPPLKRCTHLNALSNLNPTKSK